MNKSLPLTNFMIFRPILLVIMLVAPQMLFAASWMLSEGEGMSTTGLSYHESNKFWNNASQLLPSGCQTSGVRGFESVEYGYSYYYTLFGHFGFSSNNCGVNSNSGIGDVRLGVRGRIVPHMNNRSWELGMIIPTGYSRTAPLRLGYGRTGIFGGLYYSGQASGYEVAKENYFNAGAEFIYWYGPPANQFRPYVEWDTKIGSVSTTVTDRVALRVQGDFSVGGWQQETVPIIGNVLTPSYDRVSVALSYSHNFSPTWTWTTSAVQDVWGRNAGKGFSLGGHLTYHWGKQ